MFVTGTKTLLLILLFAKAGFCQNSTLDFSFLNKELESKEIVLLGEPDHVSRFYPTKIELVKYLHEKLGFDVLAFESGIFEMNLVNDLLQNENIDVHEVFQKGLFPIWANDDAMLPLFDYVLQQRKNGTPIVIAGFDCQPSGLIESKELIQEFQQALSKNGIYEFDPALKLLEMQLNLFKGGEPTIDEFHLLEELQNRISSISSLSFYSQALISWLSLFKNCTKSKTVNRRFKASDSNVRDSLMALNMLFLQSQKYETKKIIGWGATGHFANQLKFLKMKDTDHLDFKPMGWHLKNKLGSKVFILSTTSNDDEPNSLEQDLTKADIEMKWISGETLKQRPIKTTCLSEWTEGNMADAVDGILFTKEKEVTASFSTQKFIEGIIMDRRTRKPVSFASVWIEQYSQGTASNSNGEFKIPSKQTAADFTITISCIGYVTKKVTSKELNDLKGSILLEPENRFLNEVTVFASRITTKEYVEDALKAIRKNYQQEPFNLEYYSKLISTDSANHQQYQLESVIEGYYEGYSNESMKTFRLTQKRETGINFLKSNGYEPWPPFELAAVDLITDERKSGILNNVNLEKFEINLAGFDKFEGDTVLILDYSLPMISNRVTGYSTLKRYYGRLYLNSKDNAIVKHQVEVDGNEVVFSMEITYRKSGTKYFPYYLKSTRTNLFRVKGNKQKVITSNEIFVKKLILKYPEKFENDMRLWNPQNISYNENFWNTFYDDH